jgi:hypothetical protein
MALQGVFKDRLRHIEYGTLGGRGKRRRISGEEGGGGKEKGGKVNVETSPLYVAEPHELM